MHTCKKNIRTLIFYAEVIIISTYQSLALYELFIEQKRVRDRNSRREGTLSAIG